MGIVKEASEAVFKHIEAVKAAATGLGLAGCAGTYVAYEVAARYVGYADAPFVTCLTVCGAPVVVAGLGYGVVRGFKLASHWEGLRQRIYAQVAPPAALPATDAQATAQAQNVLSVLRNEQAVLVVGAKGTGKTTLLLHMMRHYRNVLVLDPHSAPGKWGNALVVGNGRNYAAIEAHLAAVVRLMTRRYDEIGSGQVAEGNHEKLLVVIDEGRSIMLNCETASESFKTLLTEARKTNIDVIVANHSSLVTALGFRGASDLKEGLAQVHLKKVGDVRSAVVDLGDGEFPVVLPGPAHPEAIGRSGSRVAEIMADVMEQPAPVVRQVPVDASRAIRVYDEKGDVLQASVRVPVPAYSAVSNGSHQSKNSQNGASTAGTSMASTRPLSAAMVAQFIRHQYATHADFKEPPAWLTVERAVLIALAVFAGEKENPIMRGLFNGNSNGRYRDGIKLVARHVVLLQKGWQKRVHLV